MFLWILRTNFLDLLVTFLKSSLFLIFLFKKLTICIFFYIFISHTKHVLIQGLTLLHVSRFYILLTHRDNFCIFINSSEIKCTNYKIKQREYSQIVPVSLPAPIKMTQLFCTVMPPSNRFCSCLTNSVLNSP